MVIFQSVGAYSETPTRRFTFNNYTMGAASSTNMANDSYTDDLGERLKKAFLDELCKRPSVGLTEVRRDGKDNAAMAKVITDEFNRCVGNMAEAEFMYHMRTYSSACWVIADINKFNVDLKHMVIKG